VAWHRFLLSFLFLVCITFPCVSPAADVAASALRSVETKLAVRAEDMQHGGSFDVDSFLRTGTTVAKEAFSEVPWGDIHTHARKLLVRDTCTYSPFPEFDREQKARFTIGSRKWHTLSKYRYVLPATEHTRVRPLFYLQFLVRSVGEKREYDVMLGCRFSPAELKTFRDGTQSSHSPVLSKVQGALDDAHLERAYAVDVVDLRYDPGGRSWRLPETPGYVAECLLLRRTVTNSPLYQMRRYFISHDDRRKGQLAERPKVLWKLMRNRNELTAHGFLLLYGLDKAVFKDAPVLVRRGDSPVQQSPVEAPSLKEQLKGVVIPAVDFEQASVGSVLQFLESRRASARPRLSLSFLVEPDSLREKKVTMHARFVSVHDVVDILAKVIGAEWRTKDGAILIRGLDADREALGSALKNKDCKR